MKKELIVIAILLAISVSAVGLSDVTGFFAGLFSDTNIITAGVEPVKVKPGDILTIIVTAEDSAGVQSAQAFVSNELGEDAVELVLVSSVGNQFTFEGKWTVHDTLNHKWYDVEIVVVNNKGRTTRTMTKYQDPTSPNPGHSLNEIGGGTAFGGEDYIFPLGINVTIGNISINGSRIEFEDLTNQTSAGIPRASCALEDMEYNPPGDFTVNEPFSDSLICSTPGAILISGGCEADGTNATLRSSKPVDQTVVGSVEEGAWFCDWSNITDSTAVAIYAVCC